MREMTVFYILYFSLIALVIQAKGGCRELDFLDCKTDKALTGHVIKTIPVLAPGLEDCQHQCFMEDRCVSYNMGSTEGFKRLCNLSDTDHVEYPDDVSSVPGAEYCAIKNPCSSNPCLSNMTCKPDFDFNSFKCIDMRSCATMKNSGINENGVYNITPVPGYTIQVYCDQVTDGGGWTVIQKRLDGSVSFYRGWDDYKRGFGDKNGEYWLGLDAIHILTKSHQNKLRVDLKDFHLVSAYAVYSSFGVDSESQKYKLHLGSFEKGDAGDSLGYHRWYSFSTSDRDNDQNSDNCARVFSGGWWFGSCHLSHLNGLYLTGAQAAGTQAQGINWREWRGYDTSLKEAEMKIRPVDFVN